MDNSNNYPSLNSNHSLPSNMYLAQQQNAYYNNSYGNNPNNANFNPNTSQTPNYYNHYQNQKKNNLNNRNSHHHLDTNQYQFLTATSSLLSSSSLCSSSTSLSGGGGRRSVGGSGSCMDYHSLNHSLQPQQLQTQLSQERKKKPTLLRKLSEKRARGYELQQHFQQQQQSLVNNNNNNNNNPYHCSSSSSSSSSLNNSFNGNFNNTQSCNNKNSTGLNTACAQKNQSNSKVNNANNCNASNQASCSNCSRRNMSTSDLHLSLYANNNSNNVSIPAGSSNTKKISANKSGNCFNSSSSNSTASSSPINSVPNSPASIKVPSEKFESSKSEKMLKKTISDPLAAVSLTESSDSDEAHHNQSKSLLTNVNTCRGTGLDDELAAFIDDQSAQSLLNSTHHFQSINIPALVEQKTVETAENDKDRKSVV